MTTPPQDLGAPARQPAVAPVATWTAVTGRVAGPVRVRSRVAPLDTMRLLTMLVVLCYVWRVQDIFPTLTALRLSLLSSIAALGFFVMSPSSLRGLRRAGHPVMKLALVMLAIMVFSIPFSIWRGNSLSFLLNDHIKTVIMMLLVVATVRSFTDVVWYARAHVVGGVIFSAYAVFRMSVGSDGRLGNLFYYDANDFGMLLVATMPLVLFFARRGATNVQRLLALATAALFVVAIVKTGSRGAFLGIIAVTFFLLLTFRAIPTMSRVTVIVAGVLAISVAGSDRYWTQMQTLLNPKDDYNWSGKAEDGRMEIWKRGVGYMMDRPLTGVGVQGFPTAEGTLSPLAARQSYGRGTRWAAAHNSFVQIGAELGFPGLIAFLAMLVIAFRGLGKMAGHLRSDDPARRSEAAMAQALRASLVGYAVAGFFLSQGYAAFLYAILGLIAGLNAVARLPEGTRAPRWSAWWVRARQKHAGA